MGQFSVEKPVRPGQLSVEINSVCCGATGGFFLVIVRPSIPPVRGQ